MRFARALPGWISVLLMLVYVAAAATMTGDGERVTGSLVRIYASQALAVSSFLAALVAASYLRRASSLIAVLHVVVAAVGSVALFLSGFVFKAGLEEQLHHAAYALAALLLFAFPVLHSIAALIGAAPDEETGLSAFAKQWGAGAGLAALSGFILIPLAGAGGVAPLVAMFWLGATSIALAGWWIGLGRVAAAKEVSAP